MIYFSTPKYEYVVIKKAKIINKINPKIIIFPKSIQRGRETRRWGLRALVLANSMDKLREFKDTSNW